MATKTNTTKSTNRQEITEAWLEEAERNISKQLKDQPKVKVMIAPDKNDPVWHGWLNGVHYCFPKGELIEVPEALAEIINQSATMAYEQKKLEDQLIKGIEL